MMKKFDYILPVERVGLVITFCQVILGGCNIALE